MSTATLEANITSVGGALQGYITTVLGSFWPLVIGVTVLVGVIYFGRHALGRLFGK